MKQNLLKMKQLGLILLLGFYGMIYSQVGINTPSPESTLDIRAKNHLGAVTSTDGILVPRVNAINVNGLVNGQLVYLVADAGSFTKGFWYWNGSIWASIGNSSFTGDTTNDAWLNDTTNNLVKLGTKADGSTVREAGTEFVAKDNGTVGIGIESPNDSAILDVASTNKGFLPPRMTNSQKNAIPNPATGLILYCTDCTTCNMSGGELLVYMGALQGWQCVKSGNGGGAIYTADCSSSTLNGNIAAGETTNANITMTVNVTSLGSYNISTGIVNGLQFVGNGNFTATGSQIVTLYPMGTASLEGTYTWSYTTGGNTCSISAVVQKSKATRIIKVLSLTGSYNLGTAGSSFFNNLINNNSTEFGSAGIVKMAYADFSTMAYSSINSTNLASVFSQYDIIYVGVTTGNNNTWDNATENAFASYAATHKSVFIWEGDDYSAASDNNTLLSKLGFTTIPGGLTGYMVWDNNASSQVPPIKGTFGNISNYGYANPHGHAWGVTTSRTDVALMRSSTTGNPIVGFWDPVNYFFYTGDDDGFYSNTYTVCGNSSPKSYTNCTGGTYTMRGARWLANLVAFAVDNCPAKAYTTD